MTDEILLFLSSSHCKCPACRRQWAVYHLVPIIKSRRITHQSSPLPLCCLSPFGGDFYSKIFRFHAEMFSGASFVSVCTLESEQLPFLSSWDLCTQEIMKRVQQGEHNSLSQAMIIFRGFFLTSAWYGVSPSIMWCWWLRVSVTHMSTG